MALQNYTGQAITMNSLEQIIHEMEAQSKSKQAIGEAFDKLFDKDEDDFDELGPKKSVMSTPDRLANIERQLTTIMELLGLVLELRANQLAHKEPTPDVQDTSVSKG
jgi:hypothetical protein